MSKYIVRVELHHADYQDYEQLHAAMEKKGFARKVQGSMVRYTIFPEAEYFVSTQRDISEVQGRRKECCGRDGQEKRCSCHTVGNERMDRSQEICLGA